MSACPLCLPQRSWRTLVHQWIGLKCSCSFIHTYTPTTFSVVSLNIFLWDFAVHWWHLQNKQVATHQTTRLYSQCHFLHCCSLAYGPMNYNISINHILPTTCLSIPPPPPADSIPGLLRSGAPYQIRVPFRDMIPQSSGPWLAYLANCG
jgi:hypothetical protein